MYMEELSNFDILEIYPLFKIDLIACIDVNDLKDYELQDGGYILNLNNMHWVALFVNDGKGFFFDSYGVIFPKIVKQFCPDITYSDDQIQSYNSVLCGYFCLFFLYFMTNKYKKNLNHTFDLFRSNFHDDEVKNNSILQKFVKKIIST